MSYRAKVIKVMIASPSDVMAERQIIRNVIQEWNNTHSEDKNVVLMPVGWESHSAPSTGNRPQAVINKQVLADCDLLVAVFWTKIGTPTGKAVSGTVEEIEEHVKAKRPALIYFSSIPVAIRSVDQDQLAALEEFKAQLRERALYAEYESTEAFREKFSRQLALTVIRHFASKKNGDENSVDRDMPRPKVPAISDAASILLIEASQDAHGAIMKLGSMHGMTIQTSDRNFLEDQNPRNIARWEAALKELLAKGLIDDRGSKGEFFTVTDEGYRVAELLREKQLAPM